MIFYNDEEIGSSKNQEIIIDCECGEHLLKIITYNNDPEVYLSIYYDLFSSKQDNTFFRRFCRKIKTIWLIIIGKDYRLDDIILTKEDANKLADVLSKIE